MAAHTQGLWRAFPCRQITGRPFFYHCYIGRDRREEHGCVRGYHRGARAADACAARAVIRKSTGAP